MRRYLALYRRGASATPLPLADGWVVWFAGTGLEAEQATWRRIRPPRVGSAAW